MKIDDLSDDLVERDVPRLVRATHSNLIHVSHRHASVRRGGRINKRYHLYFVTDCNRILGYPEYHRALHVEAIQRSPELHEWILCETCGKSGGFAHAVEAIKKENRLSAAERRADDAHRTGTRRLISVFRGEAEAIEEMAERLILDEGWVLLPPEAETIIEALTVFIREAPRMPEGERQGALDRSIAVMNRALDGYWERFDKAFGNR